MIMILHIMVVNIPSNNPLQILYDMGTCGCDAGIPVPLLHLGAGGGSETTGDYTGSLMVNTNLTYRQVLVPGTTPPSDYGHADLWSDYAADELGWDVLYNLTWIILLSFNKL